MAAQGGNFPLGDRNEAWDAGAAERSYELPEDANCYLWRDPNGDPATKAAYKLPFVSKSGGKHAVWGAITAAAQRLSQTQGIDVSAVQRKLSGYYAKAREKYGDDSIVPPWEQSAVQADEMRFAVAPITHVDVRDPYATSDNTWTMSGYAAVYNEATTLYDGKYVRLTESVSPVFFDRVLREQQLSQAAGVVHFNFGHDMNRAVAATDVPAGQPGSLQLRSDAHGLHFLARVPKDDPDGVAMAAKMRSGVLRQASFAFTVAKDQIEVLESDDGPEHEHRTLVECRHLYDVCATPQGAYSQTVAGLRSLGAALGQPATGGQPHQSGLEGAVVVSPSEGGDVDGKRREAEEAAEEALAEFDGFRRRNRRRGYIRNGR